MVRIKSEEWIIYKGTVGKFEGYYDVTENLYDKEAQDKVAKYILKLMKHKDVTVDFKLSNNYTVFTLMKVYGAENKMSVIFFSGVPTGSWSPTAMYTTDINLKNIKAEIKKATEQMFETINI